MRAGIETKAAKAGALRGRSGRKRRDRAEKSCPGFDLRGELRTTGPYLPAKWRSQRNGQVFRVRKGSGASAGNDQRGERRKPVPPPDCMGPGPRSKEGPLLYRNGVSFSYSPPSLGVNRPDGNGCANWSSISSLRAQPASWSLSIRI